VLTEPLAPTVTGLGTLSLPRVKSQNFSSSYQSADGNFLAEVSHQKISGKRIRSVFKFTQRAVVADPLTAANDYELLHVYTVVERPEVGFSVAQIQNLVGGHQAYLTSAIVAKLMGGES